MPDCIAQTFKDLTDEFCDQLEGFTKQDAKAFIKDLDGLRDASESLNAPSAGRIEAFMQEAIEDAQRFANVR